MCCLHDRLGAKADERKRNGPQRHGQDDDKFNEVQRTDVQLIVHESSLGARQPS